MTTSFVFPPLLVILAKGRDLLPADHGDGDVADRPERGPVARMHLPDAGPPVQQPVEVRRRPEHADHDLGDIALGRGLDAVHQVEGGVRGRPIARPLGTDHDDGHGGVLDHEGQYGRRVVHGVRAVADHDALNTLGNLPSDGLGRSAPLLGPHVLAEDAVELLCLQVADVGQLGHRTIQLARRECRDDRARPVIEPAGDRPSRAQKLDPRLFRVVGELLFRDLVMGFLPSLNVDRGNAVGQDPDVVSGVEFKDDVQGIGRFGTGQDDARVHSSVRRDPDVAPDLGLEALEDVQSPPLVSFVKILVHHQEFPSSLSLSRAASSAPSTLPRHSSMSRPMARMLPRRLLPESPAFHLLHGRPDVRSDLRIISGRRPEVFDLSPVDEHPFQELQDSFPVDPAVLEGGENGGHDGLVRVDRREDPFFQPGGELDKDDGYEGRLHAPFPDRLLEQGNERRDGESSPRGPPGHRSPCTASRGSGCSGAARP